MVSPPRTAGPPAAAPVLSPSPSTGPTAPSANPPPAAPARPAPLEFSIRGSVHNPVYQPIAGATVTAMDPHEKPLGEARSDAKGDFALTLLPTGSYLVRTTAPGYQPSLLAIDLGPTSAPLDVILATHASRYFVEVHQARAPLPARNGTSTAVVSRQTLATLPGGDERPITDVLTTQPGFVYDSFGAVHARGNHADILYEVDGVPLPTSAAGQFATSIPTRLVENLVLITGGIPAEYGDQLSAVVDITTRHGSSQPAGEAQVEYGTYQLVQPAFDFSTDIGNASVFVGANFQSTDRGLDAPAVSPILHDQLLSGSAFARVDYLLGDRDRLELLANYLQNRYQIPIDPTVEPLSNGPPGAVRGPDIYGNPPPTFVPYDANPIESERDTFVSLSYTHTFSTTASLQIAPYVRDSYGDLLCDPTGSLGATADPGSTCADVLREIVHEGGVANLSWAAGPHQAWKAGLLVDEAQSHVGYDEYFRNDASPFGGADPAQTLGGYDDTQILLAGAYLQDKLTFGKLTIFPGMRLDLQSADFLHTGLPNALELGPSVRLGAAYAFTDELVAHAFAGYLWQPPSVLDAPIAARVLVPGLAGQPIPFDIQPEKDWYGEVGLADRFFRSVTLSLTGWGKLSQDQLDDVTVGNTNLLANYNFARGRAVGTEAAANLVAGKQLSGFANVSWEIAQGQGIASATYLFTPQQLADQSWQTLDHVQTWTANVGFDLHDAKADNHLSGLFNYGSGLRTGADNTLTVPPHATVDVTLRHRFDIQLHPEVALDIQNLFDELYAYRIANGFVGSSYGPLRQVDVRLIVPFGA
ncbi:MAG: TonB-dependent receptor [Deltaproteobacteria bacterium]